eukprot:Amastigsp_a180009_53.p3 type:complete len:130 gc:universal Amastigsp_a180009_53:51-440(+)
MDASECSAVEKPPTTQSVVALTKCAAPPASGTGRANPAGPQPTVTFSRSTELQSDISGSRPPMASATPGMGLACMTRSRASVSLNQSRKVFALDSNSFMVLSAGASSAAPANINTRSSGPRKAPWSQCE